MGDLLPCPFCGDRLVQRHAGWFDHPKSKCILSGRAFHKGWIGQWNKRADLAGPQDAARIAELETQLASGSFYQEKDIDRMQNRIAELEAEVASLKAQKERVKELVETAQWARNRLEAIADHHWWGDGRDLKRSIIGVFADFDLALASCGSFMPAALAADSGAADA